MRFLVYDIRILIACAMVLNQFGTVSRATQGSAPALAVMTERQVRAKARKAVLPRYPVAASRERAQGVVVASIEFDAKGIVSKVAILESAHLLFEAPTRKAIYQWRFSPSAGPDGKALGGRSILTFYFYFRAGKGWVRNPVVFESNKKPAATDKDFSYS